MNIVHLGILAERKLIFINDFSEPCTRASAGPPYTHGFHLFVYKNTHHAVPNRRGGTCPKMCGVSTIRTGGGRPPAGNPEDCGEDTTTPGAGVSYNVSGSCQQLWGGTKRSKEDLSSYNLPCLEAACHSPDALLSKGVKLRKGWQGERGCPASRVRYFRIRITDHCCSILKGRELSSKSHRAAWSQVLGIRREPC